MQGPNQGPVMAMLKEEFAAIVFLNNLWLLK
jgi:hypothetical protein